MEKNDLDAVKLLADWSKWLASLQTAAISVIGLASVSGRVSIANATQPGWVIAAVILFLVSLLAASFLLFSLPGVAQRLPPPANKDVLMMGTFNGGGIPIVVFSVIQFVCFGTAVSCLGIWAVLQLLHPTVSPA